MCGLQKNLNSRTGILASCRFPREHFCFSFVCLDFIWLIFAFWFSEFNVYCVYWIWVTNLHFKKPVDGELGRVAFWQDFCVELTGIQQSWVDAVIWPISISSLKTLCFVSTENRSQCFTCVNCQKVWVSRFPPLSILWTGMKHFSKDFTLMWLHIFVTRVNLPYTSRHAWKIATLNTVTFLYRLFCPEFCGFRL